MREPIKPERYEYRESLKNWTGRMTKAAKKSKMEFRLSHEGSLPHVMFEVREGNPPRMILRNGSRLAVESLLLDGIRPEQAPPRFPKPWTFPNGPETEK